MARGSSELIIEGERYCSLPVAAHVVGVAHMTMFRWVSGRVKPPVDGFDFRAYRDPKSGHYYMPLDVVDELQWLIGVPVIKNFLGDEHMRMLSYLQSKNGCPYHNLPTHRIIRMLLGRAVFEEYKRYS